MSRVYLASSWRNPNQPGMVERLRYDGHEVYDFRNPPSGVPGFAWSEIDLNWQNWTAEEYRNHLTTHPIAARGYGTKVMRKLIAQRKRDRNEVAEEEALLTLYREVLGM